MAILLFISILLIAACGLIYELIAGTVDFGASDGPMSDENLAKAPGKILHIPTVAGAVVVTYNLPGNPKAVRENLSVIAAALPHAISTLRGQVGEHNRPT